MLTKEERELLVKLVFDPNIETIDISENKNRTNILIHMVPEVNHEEYKRKMMDIFLQLYFSSKEQIEPIEEKTYLTYPYIGSVLQNEGKEKIINMFFKNKICKAI